MTISTGETTRAALRQMPKSGGLSPFLRAASTMNKTSLPEAGSSMRSNQHKFAPRIK